MQRTGKNAKSCRNHPKRAASYKCENCGEYFCDKCVLPAGDSRPVCRGCAVQLGWPNARSGGLTALGVIAIVFGSLGILVKLYLIAGKALSNNLNQGANYATMQKLSSGPLHIFLFVSSVFTAILLLCAGIGLLKLKHWAFGAVITYCVLDILLLLVSTIRIFSIMGSATSPREQAAMIVMAFLASIALVIGLVLPIIYLVCVTRPAIKAQLRA